MVLVTTLKSQTQNNIDSRFWEVVPDTCEACESPLDLNMALTELKCINPSCSDKMSMRVSKMCDALGIKYFGLSSIDKWMEAENVFSPMQLFEYSDQSLIPGLSYGVSDKVTAQLESLKSMKLWEFVANSQLPYIQTVAKVLLKDISTLEELFDCMDDGGIQWVQDKLGIGTQYDDWGNVVASATATKVYTSLLSHKEELLNYVGFVNIVEESNLPEIIIVMSDEVGGNFKRKKDFFNFISERYKDHAQFTLGSSVTKKTNVTVWRGFDGSDARVTSKVQRTYDLHNQGYPIQGFTADEFIKHFDEEFGIA